MSEKPEVPVLVWQNPCVTSSPLKHLTLKQDELMKCINETLPVCGPWGRGVGGTIGNPGALGSAEDTIHFLPQGALVLCIVPISGLATLYPGW